MKCIYTPIDGTSFDPQSDDMDSTSIHIRYYMGHAANVRVKIFSLPNNTLVRSFDEYKGQGEQESIWDGTAADGLPVSLEYDYLCEVYEILPGGSESLIVSIDPYTTLPLGRAKAVSKSIFVGSKAVARVFVPTGGTLTAKIYGAPSAYTMEIYKYNNGDIIIPFTSGTLPDGAKYVEVEVTAGTTADRGTYCIHVYRNGSPASNMTVVTSFVQVGSAWSDPPSVQPFIGHWWPGYLYYSLVHLYDSIGPLDKYDAYMVAKYGGSSTTRANEIAAGDYHYFTSGETWQGHCHAWSASACLHTEPRTGKRHVINSTTIDFSVGDLKGLLAAAYNNYQFRPESEWWRDDQATTFHTFLVKWLRGSHQAVIADVNTTDERWFHPLYKYEATMTADPRNSMKVTVSCVVYFLNYGYPPDQLTPIPPNPATATANYWLKFNLQGGVTEGDWATAGEPELDYFIPPTGASATGCGGVMLEKVNEIITGGSEWP